MGVKETNIMNAIMVALSGAGCLVWRNNTGAHQDTGGRLVRYGLGKGSSDLVGIAPDGVFFAIEVKTATGRASEAQHAFIAAVRRHSGRAGIARDPAEAVGIALPGIAQDQR